VKATTFSRFGKPDVLAVVDLPDRVPGDADALVRVEAASINPSDVKNVAGAMSQTTLPRIPGRDFAGVVEAGPDGWIGAQVWGSGNAGFTTDGSHAQYIIVPVASLRRKPETLSFDQAASVGVNYLTAHRGLVESGALHSGETLAIIGAGGGVGSAVAQIARRMGARKIIGVDRFAPNPASPIARATDAFIAGESDTEAAVRDALGGRGADVVFDAVGGVMFRTALACLAPRGRLIEISVTGQREVTFDLADFYHNEGRIIGVDTLKLDLIAAGDILETLRPGFEAGDYRPPTIARLLPLAEVATAYQAVADGQPGRVVLQPQG
jgi:NADPH:quinone reductase-like Zn-dependent oxidoreductase